MNRFLALLGVWAISTSAVCAQFRLNNKAIPAAAPVPKSVPTRAPAVRRPVHTAAPVASKTARPTTLPHENLMLVTDSACVVVLTGAKTYSFTLTTNSKSRVSVVPGEYYLEAKAKPSDLHIDRKERIGDDLQIVALDFQKLLPRAMAPISTPTAKPAPARYKEGFLNEISESMVLVEGGEFLMGDPFAGPKEDDQPAHKVRLTTFYMSKYEITASLFRHFLNETNYKTDAERAGGGRIKTGKEWEQRRELGWNTDATGKIRTEETMNEPVLFVSWNDAVAFCQWLTQKMNRIVGLPTEAQWEYAARGGNRSQGYTYGGSGKPDEVAWYTANSGKRGHLVGQKKANELGLFDLSGNAWEWCADWYKPGYYKDSPSENPTGPAKAKERVVRGGSWGSDLKEIRLINRSYASPGEGVHSIGFRVVSTTP